MNRSSLGVAVVTVGAESRETRGTQVYFMQAVEASSSSRLVHLMINFSSLQLKSQGNGPLNAYKKLLARPNHSSNTPAISCVAFTVNIELI